MHETSWYPCFPRLIECYSKSTERRTVQDRTIMLTRGPHLLFFPLRVTFYLFYNYDYCIANNFQERWWTFFSEFKIKKNKVCWGFSWNLALGLISENKKILCKLYKFPCFFFSCMRYIFIFYNYNYCIANNLQERILFLWKGLKKTLSIVDNLL